MLSKAKWSRPRPNARDRGQIFGFEDKHQGQNIGLETSPASVRLLTKQVQCETIDPFLFSANKDLPLGAVIRSSFDGPQTPVCPVDVPAYRHNISLEIRDLHAVKDEPWPSRRSRALFHRHTEDIRVYNFPESGQSDGDTRYENYHHFICSNMQVPFPQYQLTVSRTERLSSSTNNCPLFEVTLSRPK